VPYERGRTERDIAALGSHAIAVSPPELVEGVRAALLRTVEINATHAVAAHQEGHADE